MGRFFSRLYKLGRLLPEHQGRWGLYHGVGASLEHDKALSGLQVAQVVDIGANRGQFTLFSLMRFPEAKIIAFEPLASAASVFQKIHGKNPNVRLIQAAVAPDEGAAIIHVSAREDSSSLLPITDRQVEIFPGTEETATRQIQAGRLDSYLSDADILSPALLKIDVQGYEAEVLKACESLLHRFNSIYVECSFVELYAGQTLAPQIIEWLESRGFGLKARFNETKSRGIGLIQADFLFVRSETGTTPP